MSYEVGDRVSIRKEYINDFPISLLSTIRNGGFLIIRKVDKVIYGEGIYYKIDGIKGHWAEKYFESYVEEDPDPIFDRFELLDL